jgi:hypothetical protein
VERQRHLEKKPKIQPQIVVENKENAAVKIQAKMMSFNNISVTDKQQHQPSAVPHPKKSLANWPNIEFRVNAMKVVELRRELRNRGYDTQGLKKDLRARLLDSMLVEPEAEGFLHIPLKSVLVEIPQEKVVTAETPADFPEESSGTIKNVADGTVSDNIVQARASTSKSFVVKKMSIESTRQKSSSETSLKQSKLESRKKSSIKPEEKGSLYSELQRCRDSISSMQVEHHSTAIDEPSVHIIQGGNSSIGVQPAAPVNTMEIIRSPAPYSEGKVGQYSMLNVKKVSTESSPRVFKPVSGTKVELIHSSVKDDGKTCLSSHISEEDNSRQTSDVSTSISKESGKMVKHMISKFSGHTSLSSTLSGSSSSAVSKEMKKMKEARMAKIAEMREKVRIALFGMYFCPDVPLISFCASRLQSKTKLAANICMKPKDLVNVQSSAIVNGPVPSTGAKKDRLAAQMREKAAAHKKPFVASTSKLPSSSTHKTHLHISGGVQNSFGTTVKQPPAAKVTKPKPPSPMDTYEISDREGSDSDDSDSEAENDKQKKIPAWAVRANLLKALEEQYHGQVDGKRVDPDDIFAEVQSCDLVAIFGNKKADKYRSRNSSGNWLRDEVTTAEKLVYKRDMGYSLPTEREELEI